MSVKFWQKFMMNYSQNPLNCSKSQCLSRQRGCKQSTADGGGVGGARDELCWKSLTTSQAQAAVSLLCRLDGCVRVCRLAKPTSGLSSVCPTYLCLLLLAELGREWRLASFPKIPPIFWSGCLVGSLSMLLRLLQHNLCPNSRSFSICFVA